MTRTIGNLASELELNIETIRFYERKGLILQPSKPATGYRHYPDETVNRIRFIKRSQDLGFTLDEILNLLSMNEMPCEQVEQLATGKLLTVRQKISDLKRLESVLQERLTQCHSNDDKSHCPIIDSLQP